jgi:4-hydroxy-tetrahydrodipicolinate reductase
VTFSFVQYGFGAAGREIVRQALNKNLRLLGVVDRNPALVGRDAGEVVGLDRTGIAVESDAGACLARTSPDVVLHATSFDPSAIVEQLALVAAAGCDAVSLAGVSHPWQRHPEMAARLDGVARKSGVTLLGTGYVPGFLTDVLPIVVSGAVDRIRTLRVLRVSDFSPWGRSVLERYGFGLAASEFDARLRLGRLKLFATLWQSLDMLMAALDWPLPETGEEKDGIVSRRRRSNGELGVEPGQIGGFRHRIFARSPGGPSIELEARGFLEPVGDEERPRLVIDIDGEPSGRVELSGELATARGSLLASAARVVNAAPGVIAAPPGLLTLAQVPPMPVYRGALQAAASLAAGARS